MKTVVLALITMLIATSAFGQHQTPNQVTSPAKSEDARPAAPASKPNAGPEQATKPENEPPNPTNTAGAGSSRLSKDDPGPK